MRIRLYRAVILSLFVGLLLGSVPAHAAAPRDGDGWFQREVRFVIKIVKTIGKKAGIGSNSDGLTLPRP